MRPGPPLGVVVVVVVVVQFVVVVVAVNYDNPAAVVCWRSVVHCGRQPRRLDGHITFEILMILLLPIPKTSITFPVNSQDYHIEI